MAAEPWVDPAVMMWVGSVGGAVVGLWGAALGTAGGVLVPKGKGRGLVFGLLGIGLVVGLQALGFGLVALAADQPYAIWYWPTLIGALLVGLSVPFIFMIRQRYREAELRKMRADELK
jgi:MFS family permease